MRGIAEMFRSPPAYRIGWFGSKRHGIRQAEKTFWRELMWCSCRRQGVRRKFEIYILGEEVLDKFLLSSFPPPPVQLPLNPEHSLYTGSEREGRGVFLSGTCVFPTLYGFLIARNFLSQRRRLARARTDDCDLRCGTKKVLQIPKQHTFFPRKKRGKSCTYGDAKLGETPFVLS